MVIDKGEKRIDGKNYHQRSKVEIIFSVIKRKCGSVLRCKGFANQKVELISKLTVHNIDRRQYYVYIFFRVAPELKIETFIYNITLIKVMKLKNSIARHILGKVEIDTIIKRIQGKKLKQTERNYLSRSIRPKLIAAKLLTEDKLLEKLQRPDKSLEKKIIFNLSKYGYEIINLKKAKKQKSMGLEELIVIIITELPKPRFIEAIPILFLKNKINKFKLIEISSKYDINNELGYLIETALILARKFKIKENLIDLLNYLKSNKEKEFKYLGEEKDQLYLDFLIKTSPKRIKKWNLLGRFFDNDFIKIGESYL